MSGRLVELELDCPLAKILRSPPTSGIRIYWLGQAGFIIEALGKRIIIDPYLSDSLAEKYRGTERPHTRLMPPPVTVDETGVIDLVLCTHAHTDHMDPDTLKPLLQQNPRTNLIVPRAARSQAVDRSGVAEDRMILLSGGEIFSFRQGITVTATRAAHETLETDPEGNNRFLGYVFDFDGVKIWHSGDCVPFPGLENEIYALHPDVALLPVNGRRTDLSQNGVPGNFSLKEAISLARSIGCPHMVAHHYGLFAFNTERPEVIDAAAQSTKSPVIHRARQGIAFTWTRI
ncbi:MBL fold metallo-hydrolase [Phyllobacterium sp. SB3]|uniref:MBL fold metallo-hydrolase n=1 Tax=Phyllobacterium sp. SB3 TaxID=3156073 RepID=UPI0032AE9EE0